MRLEQRIIQLKVREKAVQKAKDERRKLFSVIGKEIRRLRKDNRVSATKVAKACGITPVYMCYIEQGHNGSKLDEKRLKQIHRVILELGVKR